MGGIHTGLREQSGEARANLKELGKRRHQLGTEKRKSFTVKVLTSKSGGQERCNQTSSPGMWILKNESSKVKDITPTAGQRCREPMLI